MGSDRDRRLKCNGTNLVTGLAAGSECFGKVSDAVELIVLEAVDQIDQQFLTDAANEARRMKEVPFFPAGELVYPHAHVFLINLQGALSTQDRLSREREREKGRGS